MAFPSLSSFFILSTFLPILFLINITPSISTHPVDKAPSSSTDNVTIICNDQPNVQLCLQIFDSIPGSKVAKDLETLAKLTVGYAIIEGKGTRTYAKKLFDQTTNETLKEVYSSCSNYYGDFVNMFYEAKRNVKDDSHMWVSFSAERAWNKASFCADALIGLKDPSELSRKNEKADMICRIVIAISAKRQGITPLNK